ncbi:fluoride efflux transporter CrcB [Acuticoccus sp. MNP-M23]|uniref:fluoride efflux transporter CrcB n=1 Tax=Acuticoccus sp. MNP-M23 TaxID=3072793 RepID=UPI002816309F|nr:fluoride efflux transporter CrcB [Acuticoccus sp. MNP-M23]WMS42807.1 fluoride efflux transporter CrcB [Acuticoccus sp. MNP-M23]
MPGNISPIAIGLLVALGGAIGASMRFWLSVTLAEFLGTHLPAATFTVNVAGSFIIGLFAILIGGNQTLTAFAMTGILGGFTTFSTFSLETVRLLEEGRIVHGLAYAGASVVTCVIAAALGMAAARALS